MKPIITGVLAGIGVACAATYGWEAIVAWFCLLGINAIWILIILD